MSTEVRTALVLAAAAVLVTLVVAVVLVVRLVRARRVLREAGLGQERRLLFWGALLYAASPVDLLPDPVLLDDIGVLLYAVHSLGSAARAARTRLPAPEKSLRR
ncbi:YkvA family protein [Streptomyces sp. NPDC050856]|uniref:YkvA family protein n=1 Tax=unclassified Streptomyces TaxID=2593676 RepID=UPI0033D1AF61